MDLPSRSDRTNVTSVTSMSALRGRVSPTVLIKRVIGEYQHTTSAAGMVRGFYIPLFSPRINTSWLFRHCCPSWQLVSHTFLSTCLKPQHQIVRKRACMLTPLACRGRCILAHWTCMYVCMWGGNSPSLIAETIFFSLIPNVWCHMLTSFQVWRCRWVLKY